MRYVRALIGLVLIHAFGLNLLTAHAEDFTALSMANWHQWRGPLANGTAPSGDPPTTWDEATNVRWKMSPPGEGSSTPIIWGNKLFLLTAIKTDRTVELPPEEPKPVQPSVEGAPPPRRAKRPNNIYQFVVMCLDRATGNVPLATSGQRGSSARRASPRSWLRLVLADDRRPASVRLIRLARHLLLQPRRTAIVEARPGRHWKPMPVSAREPRP